VDEDGVLHTFLMSGVAAANNLAKLDKKRKRPGAGGVGGGGGGGGAAHHTFPAATLHGAGSTFASRKEQRMAYSQLAKVDEEVAARCVWCVCCGRQRATHYPGSHAHKTQRGALVQSARRYTPSCMWGVRASRSLTTQRPIIALSAPFLPSSPAAPPPPHTAGC
jgi:hypothetical protein